MHVLNDIYYNRANFKYKILGGLSYTKITKNEDLKLYTVHYTQICIFVIFKFFKMVGSLELGSTKSPLYILV